MFCKARCFVKYVALLCVLLCLPYAYRIACKNILVKLFFNIFLFLCFAQNYYDFKDVFCVFCTICLPVENYVENVENFL